MGLMQTICEIGPVLSEYAATAKLKKCFKAVLWGNSAR